GSHGAFLRTSNGGETWTSNMVGTSTVKNISFADDRHGMRQVGLNVEMTDDGGAHWTSVVGFDTNPSNKDCFEVLSFVGLDPNRATAALHPTDGLHFFFLTPAARETS